MPSALPKDSSRDTQVPLALPKDSSREAQVPLALPHRSSAALQHGPQPARSPLPCEYGIFIVI